jgi:hypothetical protein
MSEIARRATTTSAPSLASHFARCRVYSSRQIFESADDLVCNDAPTSDRAPSEFGARRGEGDSCSGLAHSLRASAPNLYYGALASTTYSARPFTAPASSSKYCLSDEFRPSTSRRTKTGDGPPRSRPAKGHRHVLFAPVTSRHRHPTGAKTGLT